MNYPPTYEKIPGFKPFTVVDMSHAHTFSVELSSKSYFVYFYDIIADY